MEDGETKEKSNPKKAHDRYDKDFLKEIFTRWVNVQLSKAGTNVDDLFTDLSNGIKLIQLVEVLAHKNLGKFNKKISFRSHEMENVSIALRFLQEDEGLKLINIDSSAIVDQNDKLILGLIWTLIVHYQISRMRHHDLDDDSGDTQKQKSPEKETGSPKQRLLAWIRAKLPSDVPVTNFTSDWNDGFALAALVDALVGEESDLSNWREWSPDEALSNTQAAMNTARDLLGIHELLTPEEMINPDIDEKSVMTYLSQFPHAKKPSVKGRIVDLPAKAYAGVEVSFKVVVPDEERIPKLSVVGDQSGDVPFEMTQASAKTHLVRFTPHSAPDNLQVRLLSISQNGGSMKEEAAAVLRVRLPPSLDALQQAHAHSDCKIKVSNVDLNEGVVSAVVKAPSGNESELTLQAYKADDSTVLVADWKPTEKGNHEVHVLQEEHDVIGSPFSLHVQPKKTTGLRVWGRGLASSGIVAGEAVAVIVDSTHDDVLLDLDGDRIGVTITDEDGVALPASLHDFSPRHIAFEYQPEKAGKYRVDVLSDDSPIAASPYHVTVAPSCDSVVRAFGPGLDGGIAGQPAVFYLESFGENERVAFAVQGPSKTEIVCENRNDGSALVQYTPPTPGIYSISILSNNHHIKNSPFVVVVDPADENPQTSSVQVVGLEGKVGRVGRPLHFGVECRKTDGSSSSPSVSVVDYDMLPVETTVVQSVDDSLDLHHFDCSFLPTHIGKHAVNVTLRGVPVQGSPFLVNVLEPVNISRIAVSGPALEEPIIATQQTHLVVDPADAGEGLLIAELRYENGDLVETDVIGKSDGTYSVSLTPLHPGKHTLSLLYSGEELLAKDLNVKPKLDTSAIVVHGLDRESVLLGDELEVKVDVSGLPKEQLVSLSSRPQLLSRAVAEKKQLCWVDMAPENVQNGGAHLVAPDTHFQAPLVADKPGKLVAEVWLEDQLVFTRTLNVREGCDASRVVARGEGLSHAVVKQPARFFIDSSKAGDGRVHIELTGPAECPTHIDQTREGCAVEYVPSQPGKYSLAILYGDKKEHIPGSPFLCTAEYPVDPSVIRVTGLENPKWRVGESRSFVVDASGTADRPVIPLITTADGIETMQRPSLVPRKHDKQIFDGSLTPQGKPGGSLQLHLLYDGIHAANSPYSLSLLPESSPEWVNVVGVTGGVAPSQVSASRDSILLVDATEAGRISRFDIDVTGPDFRSRRYELTETATKGVFELRFRTDLAGEYIVNVRPNGEKSAEKRIRVTAIATGRAEDVKIISQPVSSLWLLGEEQRIVVERLIDEPNARLSLVEGSGLGLEYAMESRQLHNGKFEDTVRIRARKAGPHNVQLFYGGVPIQKGLIAFQGCTKEELAEEAPRQRRAVAGSSSREEELDIAERRYYFPEENDPSAALREANNNQLNARRSVEGDDQFKERLFPFNFDPADIQPSKLKAVVTTPSEMADHAQLIDNADGTVLVKYQPKQSGNHTLHIFHQGVVVQGTPISFYVDQFPDGYATIYGPGMQGGVVGEPAHFTVCTKHGQSKELSVSIEGPAQANINIHDNKDGTCAVSWVPPVPGEYRVHVKLGGRELRESPFAVVVAGEGSKRAHMSVGSTSEVALNITERELKGISASIKSPSGIEEPCFVRLIEGGRLGVSFTPREAGEHLITVKRDGKLLPKAPFKIKVDKSQVGDASRVEVSGEGKGKAQTQKWNEILVDTSKAGYGGLSISVQGPSKAELQCKEKKAGLTSVSYRPTEPGVYAIAIKFADHHIKSSPFTVHCTGQGTGAVKEEIKKRAEQAAICLPDQEAHFYLKLPNTSPMETTARIMDPRGNTEDVVMRDQGGQFYDIKFKPKVEGSHALSVLFKDAHINGSPFQFTVGSFSEGGAHKVRASGMGVVRGETSLPQFFNVYTREAGAGNLVVAIEGPSQATLKFDDHADGNCHVEYKVSTPGEYTVSVKFNDTHIPDSPFKVFIAPATGEARKLELASFHDSGLPVGKAFTFTVLTHRARGHLEGKVLTPSGETETIDIVPIEDGESYALRFVPKESGNHYIHVTLDGAPMRDSPFRLRVGGKDESDPTAIHASGEGLVSGQTGQKCEFVVKTCNAGSGVMYIQMDGPSKVTLDAYELETGYKARYTPLAPGDYFASIKYNGIHIPGSPFKIKIDGKALGGNGYNESSMVKVDAVAKTSKGTVAVAPVYKGDASKVTAKGSGLNKFFPGRPASFSIDTGLAGANLLMVGVVTAKGPCEEVVLKHQGNGHYIVNYRIQERLKGFVFIKYGDEDIPGSPFAIEC